MWLKFVKGLPLKEKCKFLSIKIVILLYKKDCSMMNSLGLYRVLSLLLFYLKNRTAVTKTFKAEFAMIFSHS
jgi:hypothetical protein